MKQTLLQFRRTQLIILALLVLTLNAKGQCTTPTGIIVNNITATSADIIWDTVSTATGYTYSVTTDSTVPPNGTFVSVNSLNLQGLSHDTKYCTHIRATCPSGQSAYVIKCFTTTCSGINVADLVVDNITSSTARGNWKPFPSGISYEFVIDQSSTPPTTNATSTTATNIMFQGLAPNMNYCLHVRSLCPVSNTYTDWATTCFKTPPPPNNISGMYRNDAVTIFPNPTSDIINVNLAESSGIHNLVIKDITGRTVYQAILRDEHTEVNLASITAGIYFVNISGASLNMMQRIVKL